MLLTEARKEWWRAKLLPKQRHLEQAAWRQDFFTHNDGKMKEKNTYICTFLYIHLGRYTKATLGDLFENMLISAWIYQYGQVTECVYQKKKTLYHRPMAYVLVGLLLLSLLLNLKDSNICSTSKHISPHIRKEVCTVYTHYLNLRYDINISITIYLPILHFPSSLKRMDLTPHTHHNKSKTFFPIDFKDWNFQLLSGTFSMLALKRITFWKGEYFSQRIQISENCTD